MTLRSSAACVGLWVPVALLGGVSAQIGVNPDEKMYYSLKHRVVVYVDADGKRPYVRLAFMEPVFVEDESDGWMKVRTQEGARGFVASTDLSNVWIRVSKSRKKMYLYRGMDLELVFQADFGFNAYSDKLRKGTVSNPDDWRTPEGAFHIVRKNARSKFYKALVLNYPNAEDAERGVRDGIITERQYRAVMEASDKLAEPPMSTPLGGMIEIHGDGTGKSINWTQGCVAIRNEGDGFIVGPRRRGHSRRYREVGISSEVVMDGVPAPSLPNEEHQWTDAMPWWHLGVLSDMIDRT